MKVFLLSVILLLSSFSAWSQVIVLKADELDKKCYTEDSFDVYFECNLDSNVELNIDIYVNGNLQTASSEKGVRPGKRRFTVRNLPPNRSGKTNLIIKFFKGKEVIASFEYNLVYRPVDKNYSFLGIGVGDFESASEIRALHWPVNDIIAVGEGLSSRLDGFLSSVYTNVHKEGTLGKRAEIIRLFDGLSSQLRDVNGQNVVYVYLSGHGKVDVDGEWFFLTEDAHLLDLKRTAISGAVIRDYMSSMTRFARVYLFVDACESGALFAHHQLPSNLVFYASSRENESSIESDALENSAFTKGVLSALSGTFQANEVNVKGLYNVITDVVNRETHNTQNPMLMPSDRYLNDVVFKIKGMPEGLVTSIPVRGIVPASMSLIPGGGQLYKGDYLKAGLMFGGCAMGVGGIIICESQRQNYMSQVTQTHDVNNIRMLTSYAQNMAAFRNVFIAATAALYVFNIADAAFFAGKKQKVHVSPSGVKVTF